MRRGDVYWVDFNPAQGGEFQKKRPAVIVTNNDGIASQNRVQIIPLISNTARTYPWEALVHVGGIAHKAVADQIRTVTKERLESRLGTLTQPDVLSVEQAIRIQLGLP